MNTAVSTQSDALRVDLSLESMPKAVIMVDPAVKAQQLKSSLGLNEPYSARAEALTRTLTGWHFLYQEIKPQQSKQEDEATILSRIYAAIPSINPLKPGEETTRFFELVRQKFSVLGAGASQAYQQVTSGHPFGSSFSAEKAQALAYKTARYLQEIESAPADLSKKPETPTVPWYWRAFYYISAVIESWSGKKNSDLIYNEYIAEYMKNSPDAQRVATWDNDVERTRDTMQRLSERLLADKEDPRIVQAITGVVPASTNATHATFIDVPWALDAGNKGLRDRIANKAKEENPGIAHQLIGTSPEHYAALAVTVPVIGGGALIAKRFAVAPTVRLANFATLGVLNKTGAVVRRFGPIGAAIGGGFSYLWYQELSKLLEDEVRNGQLQQAHADEILGAARQLSYLRFATLSVTDLSDALANTGANETFLRKMGYDLDSPQGKLIRLYVLGEGRPSIFKTAFDRAFGKGSDYDAIRKFMQKVDPDNIEHEIAYHYGKAYETIPATRELYTPLDGETVWNGPAPLLKAYQARAPQELVNVFGLFKVGDYSRYPYNYEGMRLAVDEYLAYAPKGFDNPLESNPFIQAFKRQYDQIALESKSVAFKKHLSEHLKNPNLPTTDRIQVIAYLNGSRSDTAASQLEDRNFPLYVKNLYEQFKVTYTSSQSFVEWLQVRQEALTKYADISQQIVTLNGQLERNEDNPSLKKAEENETVKTEIANLTTESERMIEVINLKPQLVEMRVMSRSHLVASLLHRDFAYEQVVTAAMVNGLSLYEMNRDIISTMKSQAEAVEKGSDTQHGPGRIPALAFVNDKNNRRIATFPYIRYPNEEERKRMDRRKIAEEIALTQFDMYEYEVGTRMQRAHFEVPLLRNVFDVSSDPTVRRSLVTNHLESLSLMDIYWALQPVDADGKTIDPLKNPGFSENASTVYRNQKFAEWLKEKNLSPKTVREEVIEQIKRRLGTKEIDFENPETIARLSTEKLEKGAFKDRLEQYVTQLIEGDLAATDSPAAKFRDYYAGVVAKYKPVQEALKPFAMNAERRQETAEAILHMFILAEMDPNDSSIHGDFKTLILNAKKAKEAFDAVYGPEVVRLLDVRQQKPNERPALSPLVDSTKIQAFSEQFLAYRNEFVKTFKADDEEMKKRRESYIKTGALPASIITTGSQIAAVTPVSFDESQQARLRLAAERVRLPATDIALAPVEGGPAIANARVQLAASVTGGEHVGTLPGRPQTIQATYAAAGMFDHAARALGQMQA